MPRSMTEKVRKGRLILALLLGVPSLLLFCLSLIQPVTGNVLAGDVLSAICHRMPSRCLRLPWGITGLCSRCTAFWFGLGAGSALMYRIGSRIAFWKGLPAILPMIADGIIQLHTGYSSTNLLRIVSGLAGGVGSAIVFLGSTRRGSNGIRNRRGNV